MAYSTIRKGSKGSDVSAWQEYLIKQGYDLGSTKADGVFGSKTMAATKEYQRKNGLAVDGIVGKNTWGSMNTGSKPATTNTNKEKNVDIPKPPTGVSEQTWNDANKDFEGSKELDTLETNKGKYKDEALDFYSNKDIIDQGVYDKLGEEFVVPDEVAQTDAWLNEQLGKIQSGKTSWSDQYGKAINEFLNRDKFEYDVDNDQLFQQALALAMNSGKTAMQDTIGQASALTGGYGSTYATSAGNQAYNQFIEDAYNNLPEYYQMALSAYEAEGQEMINRVNILGAADDKEYGRMVDAYGLTSDHRNRMYDEAYSLFRDGKQDALDIANLKLTENQTIGQNLRNAYDISASEYELKYTQEFNEWNTAVENAWKAAGLEQGAYQFGVSQDNWEKEFGLSEKQYRVSTGDTDGDGVLSASEKAAMSKNYGYDENGNVVEQTPTSDFKLTDPEINKVKEIYENAGGGDVGLAKVYDYLEMKGKAPAEGDESAYNIIYNAVGHNTESTTEEKNNKVKAGTIDGKGQNWFRATKGDNFDVTYEKETFRVENKGKVEDKDTIAKLDKYDVTNKSVFLHNGDAYIKYGGGYYKIGATNGFLGMGETKGYHNLLRKLQ